MKSIKLQFPVLLQIIRYGLVGALTNLLSYLIYLLITFLGLDPKITVSILYPVGALLGYFGHLKYSFAYKGEHRATLFRYILAYITGYGINLFMLATLSDKVKIPHQIVQALAIPIVAIILFLMLKFFVFPPSQIKSSI